jgi:signal peptidase I
VIPYIKVAIISAILIATINLPYLIKLPGGASVTAQLIIWIAIFAVYAILTWGKKVVGGIEKEAIIFLGLIAVSIYLIAGIFSGFKYYPALLSPYAMLGAALFFMPKILSQEVLRDHIVGLRHSLGIKILIAVTMITLAQFNINLLYRSYYLPFAQFNTFLIARTFVIDLIPWISLQILATVVSMNAGTGATIGLRGLMEGFWRLSPLRPEIGLIARGILGTFSAFIGIALLGGRLIPFIGYKDMIKRAQISLSAMFSIVATLVLVWLLVGGLIPFVVTGTSMTPGFQVGDIVIASTKVDITTVNVGDVVVYRYLDKTIIHRVVEKTYMGNELILRTKGDAVPEPDQWIVRKRQLIGKVEYTVPMIGWATIYARETLNNVVDGIKWLVDLMISKGLTGFLGFANYNALFGVNKW